MPKELFPILDKPLIHYAVDVAIAAGIDKLIFVTGRNKRAIEDHFGANNELESILRGKGQDAEADMVLIDVDSETGKSHLSVMEVHGSDISNHGVVVPSILGVGFAGLVEKLDATKAPSNIAFIGRYILGPDIFETLCEPTPGKNDEIQLAEAINIHAKRGLVETVCLNERRFDCRSVAGLIQAKQHEYEKRLSVRNFSTCTQYFLIDEF